MTLEVPKTSSRGRLVIGGGILALIAAICAGTLPLTLKEKSPISYYESHGNASRQPPSGQLSYWFGTDVQARSLLGRNLLGGAISLSVGLAAALISVILGVWVGLIAGYRGGWTDAILMRGVDILYGLPYILMVILLKIALNDRLNEVAILIIALGLVSWLTMARVVRGQVLTLRSLPYIEAARAAGLGEWRIFTRHLLPNLIGPISVYATLIVPQAILQESFLSFLGVGIGVKTPLPTWGNLAADGLQPALNTVHSNWWMLFFPCLFLAITLLCLNFLGDGLRDRFDPRRESAKI